jgi:hypothetical protein
MATVLSTVEEVEDSIEGAVIEGIRAGSDGGLQIDLVDGRILIIHDAEIIAIIGRKQTH